MGKNLFAYFFIESLIVYQIKSYSQVHLVEWVKKMVNERCPEKVLDPKMTETPSLRVLKRTLAVALRCVDQNSEKRPKIGHVVHMLESQGESLINVCHFISRYNKF